MPRYCQAKAAEFSDSQIVTEILERTCEFVIPFLGINPGSHDRTYYFGAFGDIMKSFLDPGSCSFQVILLLAASFLSFLIGVYVRLKLIFAKLFFVEFLNEIICLMFNFIDEALFYACFDKRKNGLTRKKCFLINCGLP